MEKPVIKVQLNRQTPSTSHLPQSQPDTVPISNDTRESFHSPPGRQRPQSSDGWLTRLAHKGQAGKLKVLLPVLLATVTGVLLGVCLLVLFRGQSSEATVTTVQPRTTQTTANGQTVQGAAQLAGQSLYAWQIGSFTDRDKAEKARQTYAAQGIHATVRQAGSAYQLLVGVAPDQRAGAALEAELKKMKINYYVKPLQIAARQGVVKGLPDQDAKTLAAGLDQELKLASAVLTAAETAAPDSKKVAAIKQQADSMQADEREWHSQLVKAGLNGEAAQLDTAHKQLTDAIAGLQTPDNLLNTQAKLTAFYISYETLAQELIKSNS